MSGRRTFLRGLVALPLIGGSIELIGAPRAVAEPLTVEMAEAYKTFLHYEYRFLIWDMAANPVHHMRRRLGPGATRSEIAHEIGGYITHEGVGNAHRVSTHGSPMDRAALVMSAAGVDWRERDHAD